MDRNRRQLLFGAASLGLAMTVAGNTQAQERATGTADSLVSPSTRRFMNLFRLTYPILQAPLGGVDGAMLATAVSKAGALGTMAVWTLPLDLAVRRVETVRAQTDRPFVVNYVLARSELESLRAVLAAGAPIVQFSWGIPNSDAIDTIRRAGATFGVQVTSAAGARAALDVGADYLVCQGTQAGGHVQATLPLDQALREVLGEADEKPVVAAGGLVNGSDIRGVLSRGAAGAALGTRFVATQESRGHRAYKEALVGADSSEDTVLTVCYSDNWPNATHRVLRNDTFRQWEAAGCPPAGQRPGEGDVIATRPDGRQVLRYATATPQEDLQGEKILDAALYAGEGVGRVTDIPSAGELIRRLWAEFELDA